MKRHDSDPRTQRGQTIVEFALVITIFFLAVMGIFDFGRAVFSYNTLSNAAREGARVGVIPGATTNEICQMAVAKTFLPDVPSSADCPGTSPMDWTQNSLQVQITRGTAGNPAQPVVVTLTYQFQPITPLIAAAVGNPVTLTASSSMYVEAN